MADREVIIKIPEEEYELCKSQYDTECLDVLMIAVKYGTVLPKGHGRLIDADDIDNHIIGHVDTRNCPTIIEADSESEGV